MRHPTASAPFARRFCSTVECLFALPNQRGGLTPRNEAVKLAMEPGFGKKRKLTLPKLPWLESFDGPLSACTRKAAVGA